MDKQYTDPSPPRSLGGIEKFSKEYKKRGGDAKLKDIKRKIEEADSYTNPLRGNSKLDLLFLTR